MQEIMTVKELAKYIRVSVATIYRGVDQGTIPHFKVDPTGKKSSIRFQKSTIDEWMKKQQEKTNQIQD